MAEETSTSSILDMVRRFAGADPEAEDTVLQMCYQAAVGWYAAAGVPAETEGKLYEFWVCNLAAWMYDNRGNADAGAAIPAYIVSSVHQLRPLRKAQAAAGTETGTESGTESGTDTGTESGTESGTDTGTGTEAGDGT